MSTSAAFPTGADAGRRPGGWLFGPARSAATRRILILLLFPSLVLVATLRYDFIFDDNLVILRDPTVIGTSGLRSAFNHQVQVVDVTLGYYRPLISLLYRLDWTLWGENPAGYHLTNLLWHLAATLLVYCIALRTTGRTPAAWMAAMIFAVLPAHTEAIGWIQGRVDIVPTTLGLLATLGWLRARPRTQPTAWPWAFLAGGGLLAALLAKEVAATLPLAWAVWEASCFPGLSPGQKRDRLKSLIPCAGALALAALAYGLLRSQTVGALITFPISLFPPGVRLLALLAILGEYGRVLLMPGVSLNFFQPLVVAPTLPILAKSLVVILVLGAGSIISWRRSGSLFFWFAWIPVTLSPALLFGFYAPAPERGFYTGERFLYLPSVGWCILLGILVASVWEARPTRQTSWFTGVLLGGVLLGCVGLTLVRLQPWGDPVDFYQAMQAQANLPREMQVFLHNDLGRVYLDRERFPAAQAEFLRALELKPDYALAYNNLGVLLIRQGNPREARRWLETAIRLDPGFGDAYGNLGAAYEATGDMPGARQVYERGLRVSPGSEFLERGLERLNAAGASPHVPQAGGAR